MSDVPQFGTAEYKPSPAGDVCRACKQPITGVYYRANTAMLCGRCADQLRRQIPQDSHAVFVRGIVFGLGGFFLGLGLYAGFVIATGIEIGFVSLAVGWLVGKAIMMGSNGVGGRRYQIAAVGLTYAAVSLAFIPIAIHYYSTHKPASTQVQPNQSNSGPDGTASQVQEKEKPDPAPAPAKEKASFAGFLGRAVLLGLASPFLQLQTGASGVIGLIILFVGMRFAWRMTRGVQIAIDGPYGNPPPVQA